MLIIGLCGSSGAGKGYVCEKMSQHGVAHIDTDKVYKKLVIAGSDCLKELCMFFGDEILKPDGSLDKRKLSSKVFEGENASQHLKVLNTITHRYIRQKVVSMLERLEAKGTWAAVIDAPVLFESGFNEMCDATMLVSAPPHLKLERIMKRDRLSQKKAIARLQSQLPDERLRELCDYEIINDGVSDVDSQLNAVIEKLKSKGE